ncbi:hypothetical protein D3C83_63940 [compost metagenome]
MIRFDIPDLELVVNADSRKTATQDVKIASRKGCPQANVSIALDLQCVFRRTRLDTQDLDFPASAITVISEPETVQVGFYEPVVSITSA